MPYSTWVQVDLDALEANIRTLRERVGANTRILMVVKADAYGHGAVEVSRLAERCGVDFLGVATLHEGIQIRRAGVELPTLVLSPSLPREAGDIIRHRLHAAVSSHALGDALSRQASARGEVAPVHVEVDTGMGRAGLPPQEAATLVERLDGLEGLEVEGVFTHFPCADGPDPEPTLRQLERFREFVGRLRAGGHPVPIAHAANSGAVLGVQSSWLDMVRPGLLLYGLAPEPGRPNGNSFRPVMSFRTRIVHLRWMEPGETVSYASTFVVRERSRLATVAAGYGHGYPWTLSNVGEVLVRGRRVPVVGRVTMDLTMVDVTGIPDVEVGDEVVLFGRQAGEELSAHEVASRAGTIVYELLCGIGKRVVRTYCSDGRAARATTLVGEEAL